MVDEEACIWGKKKKKLHFNYTLSDRQPSRGVLPLLWLIFLQNPPNSLAIPDSGFFTPNLLKNKRKLLLLSKTRKKALLEWDVNDNPKIREIGNSHFGLGILHSAEAALSDLFWVSLSCSGITWVCEIFNYAKHQDASSWNYQSNQNQEFP